MNMGSRPFCVINMDGSWPEMAAGCDIQAYQDCLLQFKDAWKTDRVTNSGKVGARKRKLDEASLTPAKANDRGA